MNTFYSGLNEKAVEKSKYENGTNTLPKKEKETFWHSYFENFKDPMIRILCVALAISIVFVVLGKQKWYECVGIAVAVLIATFISTWSEFKNENAFQKLQDEASEIYIKVFRSGKLSMIKIDDVVKDDIVLLQAGDLIPADGIIINGKIQVNQSTLNGESKEAEKFEAPDSNTAICENDFLNNHFVYRGTTVVSGEAAMQVTRVGVQTSYGKLAAEMQVEEPQSPLGVKLEKLAGQISAFGYIGGGLIALAYIFQQFIINNHFNGANITHYLGTIANPLNDIVTAVMLGVIIIVVAVPEGLPMMIAMVLSINMRKMLKDNVLVRKMVGIETAGSLNLLLSDKTGTITCGKLQVVTFIDGENNSYQSYNDIPERLRKSLSFCAQKNSDACFGNDGQIIGGNSTEQAVLAYAGYNASSMQQYNVTKTIPFSSEKKYSAAEVVTDGKAYALYKGAYEKIVEKCSYYIDKDGNRKPFDANCISERIDSLADNAIRIIAMAMDENKLDDNNIGTGLTFVGLLGIRDDIRPEAKHAIKEVLNAGVQVIMITGDRRETAVAIAKDAGLILPKNTEYKSAYAIPGTDAIALTSDELNSLSDEAVAEMLPHIRVISRALPTDKSRLVRIAQSKNLVVGMTGDGVNDSAALKQSDVGFAMGGGTDVAKEAGDIVILDDNFKSIAKAILYGRAIYNNIRKFIVFQLTINVCAILISLIGPFIGIHEALSITQMLWVNLVMDTLAAIAFGGEPALERYMKEKPKRRDENIVSSSMWASILTAGAFECVLSVVFMKSHFITDIFRHAPDNIYVMTGFFTFFILSAVFNAFNVRTEKINLFDNLTKNKNFLCVMVAITIVQALMTYIGGAVMRTAPMTFTEWLTTLFFAVLIVPVGLIQKSISNKMASGKK